MDILTTSSKTKKPGASFGFRSFDESVSYQDVLSVQESIVSEFQKNPLSKEVYKLIGEHPPTYTCGRSIPNNDYESLVDQTPDI